MTQGSQFIWYDLMTTDAAAALGFYAAVTGWTGADAGLPDRSYTVLSAVDTPIGGMMNIPPGARGGGAQPGWIGYIAATDVDATANRVLQAGGAIHHAPEDIPGVGRFAVVSDGQGAAFMLFKGNGEMPPAQPASTPGHVGWRELSAVDGPAAFDFYAGLFGWTKSDAIDMGPMGMYQLFAIDGVVKGGIMTRMDPAIPPHWLYYFNVDDINAAIARVKTASGEILNGPMQVPGGSWIVQGRDPQGAVFALNAPR